MHDIILPDNVKPALEWVNNRVLPKVSPKPMHALAQARFVGALDAWARSSGLGMAGTEMHFQVQPPGEIGRTLVPDVAFLSYKRVPPDMLRSNEVPRTAPDVVVEVRSREDRQHDIDEKVRVYLAAGTNVFFLVDISQKIVVTADRSGARTFSESDTLEHGSLPGFALPVRSLFELPAACP